jgi:hypothetical protein
MLPQIIHHDDHIGGDVPRRLAALKFTKDT